MVTDFSKKHVSSKPPAICSKETFEIWGDKGRKPKTF
jgi:hypothetical protein